MSRRRSQYLVVAALVFVAVTGLLRNRFAAYLGASGLFKARFAVDAPVSPESFCPGGAHPNPNVVLCDNFEDDGFERRWDIGGHQGIWPTSQFVLCTDGHFGFHDRCAAWSNKLVFDREWGFYGYDGRRAFTPQSEFYVRWYQYIGDPFVWGTLEDKSVMATALVARARAQGVSNRLHLLGLRSDVPAVLAAADIFVLPSLSEGLPLALLEAMFAACPIIASDVGDVAVALAQGDAGILVAPGDASALARALDLLLSDRTRARQLGERAFRRAGAEYDISHMFIQ